MSSAEVARLVVAVAAAAGAVVLGESLANGGHHTGSSGPRSGQRALPGGSAATSGRASAGGSGSQAGRVTVAGGPAVERSLRHGSMTVVIDQPPPGMFSEQNRSIAQGAEVAVDELDAAGGLTGHIRIKLVRQSLDGLSATAVQSRLRSEAAAVLILPCDTDSQLSLAAGASQWGMLMLAPCNSDSTAGTRYATYWPVGTAANGEAAGLVRYMSTVGYGSVFVVSAPGSQYVEMLTSDFRGAAQAGGIQLSGSASITTTTQDFSGVAHAIEAIHPKPAAIFTALPPPLVNRLAASLLAVGIGQAVVGGTATDTPATLSSRPHAPENTTFASYGFPRSSTPAGRFAAEYRRRFRGSPVGSFPGLGLETIRLLEDAVRKAGSAEPAAIQQALAGGITLRGVGLADRAYEHDGDHNPVAEMGVTKVASGAFLPLLAVTPKAG